MSYILYKTTNNLNERFYVGVHKTPTPFDFDGYLGTGSLIKKAIKKYGKENFTRETLFVTEDEEEIYSIESMMVKTVKEDPRSYNLASGGYGYSDLGKHVTEAGTGIHAATFEQRSEWSKERIAKTDKADLFARSSYGGTKCGELGKAGFQTCTPEQRLKNAEKANATKLERGIVFSFKDASAAGKKGGEATRGFKTYNDGRSEYKFKSSDPANKDLTMMEFSEFLENNKQYFIGRIYRPRNKGN